MPTRNASPYEEMIQAATGAPDEVLGILEEIMRTEIFHSTLDWQSRGEFDAAARRAWAMYRSDRACYDAERDYRLARFRVFRAEAALGDARDAGDPAEIAAAEARHREAVEVRDSLYRQAF